MLHTYHTSGKEQLSWAVSVASLASIPPPQQMGYLGREARDCVSKITWLGRCSPGFKPDHCHLCTNSPLCVLCSWHSHTESTPATTPVSSCSGKIHVGAGLDPPGRALITRLSIPGRIGRFLRGSQHSWRDAPRPLSTQSMKVSFSVETGYSRHPGRWTLKCSLLCTHPPSGKKGKATGDVCRGLKHLALFSALNLDE